MLRVILLFCVSVSAVMTADKEECHKLISIDAHGCCKSKVNTDYEFGKVEGCEIELKQLNCDGAICIAKKLGFTTADDGTFDKQAMESYVRNWGEKGPDNVDEVVNKCVKGDLSHYGPSEYCDLIKFHQCLLVNYLSHCPDWEETDVCSEVKMIIEQCAQ